MSLYQSTLVVNMLTGLGKWYEHTVVTSRACPVSQKGWNDSANCIEAAANVVGTANVIQLPKDANPKEYYFDLQWEESGGLHRARRTYAMQIKEQQKTYPVNQKYIDLI